MPFFGFESVLGWFALFSFVPFLLIYLIRPTSKELEVPSLLFFTTDHRASGKSSFFKRLPFDWIFFLHLLVLLLLCLTLVDPFFFGWGTSFRDHAVLVLDTSASMQADGGRPFRDALLAANDRLGKTTTLILVSNTPLTAFIDGRKQTVRSFLSTLSPTDSRSNIGDALLLAGGYVRGEHPSVTVISDFLSTEGGDIAIAAQALRSKGVSLEFVDVRSKRTLDNFGIIGLETDLSSTEVFVKNFGHEQRVIGLSLGSLEKQVALDPGQTDVLSSATPDESVKITLLPSDDFPSDNVAYLLDQAAEKISVLLITDTDSPFVRAALAASPAVTLDIMSSSSLPTKLYDVYVLSSINIDFLNAKLLPLLSDHVEQGAGFVIAAQQDLARLDAEQLMGLAFGTKQGASELHLLEPATFTRDIEFGIIENYLTTQNEQGISFLAAGNSSMLHLHALGSGMVVYYGLMEDASDFHLTPSYPLFWASLLRFVSMNSALQETQFASGDTLIFDRELVVDTPKKKIRTSSLVLADTGTYTIDGKKIAVNLLSEQESDLNAERVSVEPLLLGTSVEQGKIPYPLLVPLLVLILILLCFDIFVSTVWGNF